MTQAMTYDSDDNTLNDGTNAYTWDARNHLVSADNNGATFIYDGLGRRFGKTMLGANTNFLYDGLNPVQELNGTTPTANLLTGGLDERFTRTDATGAAEGIQTLNGFQSIASTGVEDAAAAAEIAGEFATGVGEAKLAYDAVTFGGAFIGCSLNLF